MPEVRGYSKLDQPEILGLLFHPRLDDTCPASAGVVDFDIAVAVGVILAARFHLADVAAPNIIFFHGNGETVADYDEIGGMYTARGVSFLIVDYRGYGRSSGRPTASNMLADSHVVLREVKSWLAGEQRTGPLIVMGRSLGSACAIELAAVEQSGIAALIIESGFAETKPLLANLGIDVDGLGFTEADGFGNAEKIACCTKPTLILHAQQDEIIPAVSAEILQANSGARSKEFLVIPCAGHNNILEHTGPLYFEVISRFARKIAGVRERSRSRR
ncbi:MAG: hypothetical protein A2511_18085 [Deltaproteobacteria bacterium RIFOXYD12_FULL_50_9]|nr:MAG: hypothetical protein A2511_18085 [Deltaproteobacteria bacterium RIFOXYD12_FULL_50_9]